MTRDTFSDLAFATSKDFVEGYDFDAITSFTITDQDPHFLLDSKLFSKFYGCKRLVKDTCARNICAVLDSGAKTYFAVTLTITTGGLLVASDMHNVAWGDVAEAISIQGALTSQQLTEYFSMFPTYVGIENAQEVGAAAQWFGQCFTNWFSGPPLVQEQRMSLEADLITKYNEYLISLSATSPTLAAAAQALMSAGVVSIGVVSLSWDRLVKTFGPVGAFSVAVLGLSLVARPTLMVTGTIGGLILYAVKCSMLGTTYFDDGTIMRATPLALGSALFIGHALSAMRHVNIGDVATGVVNSTSAGSITSATGPKVILVVKHLFHLFKRSATLFATPNSFNTVLPGLITSSLSVVLEMVQMTPYQIILTIVASCTLTAIWAIARTNRRFFRTFLATHIRTEGILRDAFEDWEEGIEDFIHWGLTIAAFVVSPTSLVSSAILSALNIVECVFSGAGLTRENIVASIYYGVQDGAGVPIWIAASTFISKIVMYYRTVGVEANDENVQRNSMTHIAALISCGSSILFISQLNQSFPSDLDELKMTAGGCLKTIWRTFVGGLYKIWSMFKNFVMWLFGYRNDPVALAQALDCGTTGIDLFSIDLPDIVADAASFFRFSSMPWCNTEVSAVVDASFSPVIRGYNSKLNKFFWYYFSQCSKRQYDDAFVAFYSTTQITTWGFCDIADILESRLQGDCESTVTSVGEFTFGLISAKNSNPRIHKF